MDANVLTDIFNPLLPEVLHSVPPSIAIEAAGWQLMGKVDSPAENAVVLRSS
jgi:hypothetical protein